MARPELRAELRRIDDGATPSPSASVWFWVAVLIGGAVWIDRWWAYLRRLRPDGADVRALRHPHARGRPQAPVHRQAGQRLGRHLAGRLPHVDAHRPLPARALRPPQGGVRPERARHRLLRRLPVRPPGPGPAAGARRGGHLGVEELRPAVRGHSRYPAYRRTSLSILGVQARAVGGAVGDHRAGGGSTRCCGGCRG